MTVTRKAAPLLTLAALTTLSLAPAHADQAFTFTSASQATYDPTAVELGYNFTTGASPVDVTALGFINDGFNGTHGVQLFQVSSQAALLPAPVDVTTVGGGPKSTTFTYTSLVSPVMLAANTQYQIVSQVAHGEYYFNYALGLTSSDGLTMNAVAYNYGNTSLTPTFATSTETSTLPGDFGPNFQITAVPEPSSVASFGLGGLGLLGLMVKARRR